MKPTVAILCAARNSVYKTLPGLDVYDIDRDCRTFRGGMPIVAHPPCRAWSAYCRHQAKPVDGEKELAPWCLAELRAWGGVLEHPAHSVLWDEFKLPKPGWEARGDWWSMEVNQSWFGDSRTKKTWLLFSKILPHDLPEMPYRLHDAKGDRRRWQVMSKHQRAATCPQFAEWLIEAARSVAVAAAED